MSHKKMLPIAGVALIALMVLVPVAAAQDAPSVTVSDQAIINNTVVVDRVVSAGPGWIVIHAQAEGRPGPILGYSWVADGTTENVGVEIDAAKATKTLYAMLHVDGDKIGTWQFPEGPDGPATVDGAVVTPPFDVTAGVGVANQSVMNGAVTVAKVYSAGPGWIVVHAQQGGKPGPILGQTRVDDGENSDVVVQLNTAGVTPTLYAMLHTDAGELGAWEFPGGPDVPVKARDVVLTPAFLTAGGPESLPISGGFAASWPFILIALGALVLIGGLGYSVVRQTR